MGLFTIRKSKNEPSGSPSTDKKGNDDDSQGGKASFRRKSLCQKVDTTGVIAIFLGPPMLLLAITFLVLFWWESIKAIEGEEPEAYWFRIVDADWATRLVTICTTTIRAVVSFQAGLATAMVAGIVLETRGIPLFHGPLYSILRAVKVAPSSLFTATDFRPHLPPFIYTLVVAEVLVTTVSQFLSTIYLSDFTDGTFTQSDNSTNVKLIDSGYMAANGWWTMPPAASWTFGELSEPFKEATGYHDTGHTFRAFLPFDEEAQRLTLRKFRGPVPIMDHRVVCASAPLQNLTLALSTGDDAQLSGIIPTDNLSYPLLFNEKTEPHIQFSCKVPRPYVWESSTTNETGICLTSTGILNWTVLQENPLVQPGGYPDASQLFIIIDLVSEMAVLNQGFATTIDLHAVQTDGPWSMARNASGADALRVSACLTNLASQTITAGMNSSSDNQEPKLTWNNYTQGYDTEASRRQLGASRTRDSFDRRGVLALEPRSQWGQVASVKNYRTGDINGAMTGFFMAIRVSLPTFLMSYSNLTSDPGAIFSKRDTAFADAAAHQTHVDLFHDTLNATDSPALAIQALLTRIYQMCYYDQFAKFQATAASTTAFSTVESLPAQWTGFILGTVLVATHLVIVTIIIIQFIKQTDHSIIGNYWQTVSQVVSEETRPILEQADRMDDQEVKRWVKRNLQHFKSHRILRDQRNGQVSLGMVESGVPIKNEAPPGWI
ncbi:uncharacterized protein BO66DRAFT_395219 [Aspergillus aculeatinus CBS 121060]|uniref:Uncharacterized protein n=1 Tax=Aspergillus aculeatinus CBS 121060 TaxID=1448322 RepID=A0ACD1GWN9_9EURO|nr:hypothetical protein BO66DRAFT_395219 [Aspergillus aculeatinus CBS 121060]RAH65683.1 hypothetical protein BO66DRAFT_395219 [Aspergillus aculeatinus CBS 121060]